MKTIARILSASVLMIIMFSSYSFAYGNTNPGTGYITYEVTVHITGEVRLAGGYYYVAITDEHGRMVAPVQIYNPAKQVYLFQEFGPVKDGTRIAAMIPVKNAENPNAYFVVPPDVKVGSFAAGSIYFFNLWPTTTRTR